MIAYPELRTERLVLRLPDLDEAGLIAEYVEANRDFHVPWSPLRTEDFYTEAFWIERLPAMRAEFERGTALVFYMFPRTGPKRIAGRLAYSQIVRRAAQFCFLGYEIDVREQGRGLMTEALRASNDYMFRTMNLHRIMANYIPRNEKSGAVLRRLGFVFEGLARDYLLINGKWEDHIMTSLTNAEWRGE